MGYDIRLKSKNVFNSYLTLGLLQIGRDNNPCKIISRGKIFSKIPREMGVKDSRIIGRYIDDIKKWLSNDPLTKNSVMQILETKSKGTRLKNEIPEETYKDFVSALLLLNLIEDENHKELLEGTFVDNNENSMSIITKLTIAKFNQVQIKIELINNLGQIEFVPLKFRFNKKGWFILGKNITEGNHEIELKLSSICTINYPNIIPQ